MSRASSWHAEDIWPHDTMFALGVAVLNYGLLEEIFEAVFTNVLALPSTTGGTLFQKLNNQLRIQTIMSHLEHSGLTDGLKSDVEFFLKNYNTCAINRNGLLHSFYGGLVQDGAFDAVNLIKKSKSYNEEELLVSAALIRRFADEMVDLAGFGALLAKSIIRYRRLGEKDRGTKGWHEPSPDRPHPPNLLVWKDRATTSMPPSHRPGTSQA